MNIQYYCELIESKFLAEFLYSGVSHQIRELLISEFQRLKIKISVKGIYILNTTIEKNKIKRIGYLIKNRIKFGTEKYLFYNLISESLGSALSNITYRYDNEVKNSVNYPAITRFIKKYHKNFETRISKIKNTNVDILPLGVDYIEYNNFFNTEIINSIIIEMEIKIGEFVKEQILSVLPLEIVNIICNIVNEKFCSSKEDIKIIIENYEKYLSEKYDIISVSFNKLIKKTEEVKLQMFINKVLSSGMQSYVLAELYVVLDNKMRDKLLRNISKQHKRNVISKSSEIIKNFSLNFNRKNQQKKILEENINLKLKPILLKVIETDKNIYNEGYYLLQEIIINREIESILGNNTYENILKIIQKRDLQKEFYNKLSRNNMIKALLEINPDLVQLFISHLSENGKEMFYDDMKYFKNNTKTSDILKSKLKLLKLYKELSGNKRYYTKTIEKYNMYLNAIQSESATQYIYGQLPSKYFIISLLNESDKFVFNIINKLSNRPKSMIFDEIKILKQKIDDLTILKAKEKIVEIIEDLIENGKIAIRKC